MKAKKIILKSVDLDLLEIVNWYNKIDRKLSLMFFKEFKEKVNYISKNPSTCEKKYDDTRIAYLKKFPYSIHYIYEELENRIIIYSVFHTSRNPETWSERK